MTNRFFPFSRFTIHGNSMLPVLKPGQNVLVFNWAYIFSKPKIGDIVVIKHNGKEIIKRVQKVTGCELFVLGDNFGASTDSRDFGTVKKSDVLGKVILINSSG